MGHRHTSAQFRGEGGVHVAGDGIGAPAARHPGHAAEGMSVPARVLLFLVRVYQAFFSALMPSACKFYPSCSHYAAEAVAIHGARRGSWLALRRVGRCHPFSRGGVDLVPDSAIISDGANSRTGFSLSGVDLDLVAAKSRQAEACPTSEEVPS
jgi:putative membrane protein insertion efficiency factor